MEYFLSHHSHVVPSYCSLDEKRGLHVQCVQVNWCRSAGLAWTGMGARSGHVTSGLIAIGKKPIKLDFRLCSVDVNKPTLLSPFWKLTVKKWAARLSGYKQTRAKPEAALKRTPSS